MFRNTTTTINPAVLGKWEIHSLTNINCLYLYPDVANSALGQVMQMGRPLLVIIIRAFRKMLAYSVDASWRDDAQTRRMAGLRGTLLPRLLSGAIDLSANAKVTGGAV